MLIPSLLVLGQTQTAQGAGPGWLESPIIPLAVIFGVFYFLVLRPQQKKAKKKETERAEMLANLKRGDRVITIGGIHGEVESVESDYVILTVDRQREFTLKMSRSAIHTIQSTETKEDKK